MPTSLILHVITCPVALASSVQAVPLAADPHGGTWGSPVLSANGLARWGVWGSLYVAGTAAGLAALAGVVDAPDLAAADLATGWIDVATPP